MSEINIPILSIRMDGGTQPRASLDKRVIEDYREAMADGAAFPPVDLYYDGTNYWLADGFHRLTAAIAAGRDEIAATVHQGSQADAQWYSFSANKSNGLRRTNADKQRTVKAALKHPNGASQSNYQIAAHVGVDEWTVRKWRETLSTGIPQIARRTVTRAGATYRQNTANIGKAKRRTKRETKPTPPPPAELAPEAVHACEATVLRIDRDVARKIGKFPLNEPSVRAMACSGSNLLFLTRNIVDHINSGKRTRRLVEPAPYQGVAPAAESISHRA
jgi:uncharacterized ParB-like nuclease family protein